MAEQIIRELNDMSVEASPTEIQRDKNIKSGGENYTTCTVMKRKPKYLY